MRKLENSKEVVGRSYKDNALAIGVEDEDAENEVYDVSNP